MRRWPDFDDARAALALALWELGKRGEAGSSAAHPLVNFKAVQLFWSNIHSVTLGVLVIRTN